ncbi:MAG: hypothetical protein M5U25_11390 [Planctomycetota bacterium]|nr:hypothetical protein [Planctomycetota bacterium]
MSKSRAQDAFDSVTYVEGLADYIGKLEQWIQVVKAALGLAELG